MTETTLPPWQSTRIAVLLDALDGMAISDGERASLAWLAGFAEVHRPGGGFPGHRRGYLNLGEGVVPGGA